MEHLRWLLLNIFKKAFSENTAKWPVLKIIGNINVNLLNRLRVLQISVSKTVGPEKETAYSILIKFEFIRFCS